MYRFSVHTLHAVCDQIKKYTSIIYIIGLSVGLYPYLCLACLFYHGPNVPLLSFHCCVLSLSLSLSLASSLSLSLSLFSFSFLLSLYIYLFSPVSLTDSKIPTVFPGLSIPSSSVLSSDHSCLIC